MIILRYLNLLWKVASFVHQLTIGGEVPEMFAGDNRSREHLARGCGEDDRIARRPDEIPESSFHANKISSVAPNGYAPKREGKTPSPPRSARKRH